MSFSLRIVATIALSAAVAVPAAAQTRGVFLGDLTWPEAERRLRDAPMVILPFGAGAKEHGPHLPLASDRLEMEYFTKVAVDSLPGIVAPPILHGWFPAFAEFPGVTIDDPDVFSHYVLEAARSLVRHGARRVVFLNAVRDYRIADTSAAYPGYRPSDYTRKQGDPDYSTTGL